MKRNAPKGYVAKRGGLHVKQWMTLALLLLAPGLARGQFGLSRLPSYKVLQTIDYVTRFYVDTVNSDELLDNTIRALLDQLDPHSAYITRAEAQEVTNELEGHFFGIGIEFNISRDTLRVVSAIPNGPAEKVGMRSGDRIMEVDGENVAGVGLTNGRVMHLLRGEKGSLVRIKAQRDQRTYDYTITRGELPIHTVDVSYMIRPGIGYVRQIKFAQNSTREMEEALRDLRAQGMRGLILDLRGNGGGIMQQAFTIASLFLAEGQMVVYAQGRAMPKQEFFTLPTTESYHDIPLVVLVDEYSASASEILSGALQDWDRAVIVGRRTFGKGLVQNQIPLSDGALIRVTVARYYTPSGRSVQTPYRLGQSGEYRQRFVDRYRQGEVYSQDSVRLNDSLRYKTLRSQRTVYGGGGIMPDIFVPIDTTGGSLFVGNLVRAGADNDWITAFYEREKAHLHRAYPDYEAFAQGWALDSVLEAEIIRFAKGAGVEIPAQGLVDEDRRILAWRMKAMLARQMYGFNRMVQLLNEQSDEIHQAIRILNHWETEGLPLLAPPNPEKQK